MTSSSLLLYKNVGDNTILAAWGPYYVDNLTIKLKNKSSYGRKYQHI
jgi:hypothetical protein